MTEQLKCKGGGDDGCFTILAVCFVLWASGIFGVDEQVEKLQQDINSMKLTIERMESPRTEQLKQKENQ